VLPPSQVILAIHDLRLVRMQPQSAFNKPPLKIRQQPLSLMLTAAVTNGIIGKAFKRSIGMVFGHPLIERIMQKEVLPSTVQSSIAFTSIARGNVPAALCAATASNLLGMGLTPLLIGLLLSAQGGFSVHGASDIVLQLLLPFAAGQLARPWIGDWALRHKTCSVWSIADRSCWWSMPPSARASRRASGRQTPHGGRRIELLRHRHEGRVVGVEDMV
jgi:predicted Na+-dependent transporter